MRHHDKIKRFGRVRKQRVALMRSLANSLILSEKLKTTEPKAKALRSYIEPIITKAKNSQDVSSRRLLISKLGNEEAVAKVFSKLAPQFKDRNGGYTRIVKLPKRLSDASPIAIIEFVS